MKKLFQKHTTKRQSVLNTADSFADVTATPVTKYKTRRQIFNQKAANALEQQQQNLLFADNTADQSQDYKNNISSYKLNDSSANGLKQTKMVASGTTGSDIINSSLNDSEQSLLSDEQQRMAFDQKGVSASPSPQVKVKSSFLGSAGSAVKASFSRIRGGNQSNVREGTGASKNTQEESFIDFSFMKNEQRNLEKEESLIYNLFQKRVKRWSWFVLVVSFYLLLNVFIGFSSAPFYRKVEKCSRFDPTEDCQYVMNRADQLYATECVAGLCALTQGIMGIVLADNIKIKKLVTIVQNLCWVGCILYPVLFIVRLILYVFLHQEL